MNNQKRRRARGACPTNAIVSLLLCAALAAQADTICLEAEQFADRGGWVVDSQFIDQMGSSFLLAHGMGTPVADATTSF